MCVVDCSRCFWCGGCKKETLTLSGGGSSICQRGGATMESAERKPVMGIWNRPPAASRSILRDQGLSWKFFCPFSYKRGPNVKDLNACKCKLPPCPRQTAYRSHDQSLLLVNGGRRSVSGSAMANNVHWYWSSSSFDTITWGKRTVLRFRNTLQCQSVTCVMNACQKVRENRYVFSAAQNDPTV